MPEQLSDLLHRSVDDVAVPRADALAIARRGRTLRTRRRVGTVVATTLVVGALGVGGVVVSGALDDGPRSSDIAQQDDGGGASPEQVYDAQGAYAAGNRVTIGDTTVALDAAPAFLAQTAAGVVAQVLEGGGGAGESAFVLVRPDGTVTDLSIPRATTTIDGDPTAPRVAWIELGTDEGIVHVWDVADDTELAAVEVSLPGATPTLGRQYLQPVGLDGEAVYVGTGTGSALRVTWRTGAVAEVPRAPVAVRSGTAVTYDGDRWYVTRARTGEVVRSLGRDLQIASVSPDGRWVFYVDTRNQRAHVTPAAGGAPVEVPGLTAISTWTRDGHLLGGGARDTVRRCATDATCEDRPGVGLDGENPVPLVPDYHMVG